MLSEVKEIHQAWLNVLLTKLEATSISQTRCDLPEQPIGTKVKKTEYELTTFGYKRPNK